MTTPLSVTSRSAGRGPNRTLFGAGLPAPARVRAVPSVLVDGTPE
ncbi:hypothetical protein ACGFYE_11020 [Streptomyces zaomyceticus]